MFVRAVYRSDDIFRNNQHVLISLLRVHSNIGQSPIMCSSKSDSLSVCVGVLFIQAMFMSLFPRVCVCV